MKFNPQPKQKPLRSKKAREWYRQNRCVICGDPETCLHHEPLNGHGMGSKGPDNEGVPLCFHCHRSRHGMGRESFWFHSGLDWRELVEDYKQQVNAAINKA